MRNTKILVVDEYPVVRLGLKSVIETVQDFCVVGDTDRLTDALKMVETLEPDIMITELLTAEITLQALLRSAKKRLRKTRVMVFTRSVRQADIRAALAEGVAGYIVMDCNPAEIIDGIRVVASGGRFVGERAAQQVLIDQPAKDVPDPYSLLQSLTIREQEVLALAADGASAPKIAEALMISSRTVETHRSSIMRKLRVRNFSELIRFAVRCGVISLNS